MFGLSNPELGVLMLALFVVFIMFGFPIAFTLNRLGQHYDIDPADPAKWGTLMRGSWFWDFAFINSNYHLEHHYFPGVPLYRLAALHRLLQPFFGLALAGWLQAQGLQAGERVAVER